MEEYKKHGIAWERSVWYTFDITKIDKIFEHLLADKILQLQKGHKIPLIHE